MVHISQGELGDKVSTTNLHGEIYCTLVGEAKIKGAGKAASRGAILVDKLEKQVQRLHLLQEKD